MVIELFAGSVSPSEVAPGRSTFRFPSCGMNFSIGSSSPSLPSSNSSSAAQEVISLVLENTRKMWSVRSRRLRFLVGPADAVHVDELAPDHDCPGNARQQIAVDIALHGRLRRLEVVTVGGDFQVFHGRSPSRHSHVVPAKAGTHNHQRQLLDKVATTSPYQSAAAYGSRPSPGRRRSKGSSRGLRSRLLRRHRHPPPPPHSSAAPSRLPSPRAPSRGRRAPGPARSSRRPAA